MVSALASRVAGRRLSMIVVVLLLPILLLSFLLVRELRTDIADTQGERVGLDLARSIMPLALSAAGVKDEALDSQQLINRGRAQAAAIGLDEAYKNFEGQLAAKDADAGQRISAVVTLLQSVSVKSGLILDASSEAYFLAETSTTEIPELLEEFHEFHANLIAALDSAGIDGAEMKALLVNLGKINMSLERCRDALQHAKASSKQPEQYSKADSLIDAVQREMNVAIDVISKAKLGTEWLPLSMLAKQNYNPVEKFSLAEKVWGDTTSSLDTLLSNRLSNLKMQLWLLMALAGVCLACGAGGSYWMFSSTLRKLDLVETALSEAEAAQLEAEAMSATVVKVNEEVVALNRDLADKMKRLREAQDELIQKGRMEQLGQLTATIAHEIRNPLGSVRTSAFLLDRKISGKGLGVEAQIERINKGVTRCDNIITQLLDYSRTRQLIVQPENLDTWLEQTMEEVAERLPAMVSIELSLGLHGRSIPFDPSRLQRAVTNLVTNAAEAMVGDGTDPSKIKTSEPRILVSTAVDGSHVVIRIEDNGPGISPENLDKIREPLFTTKSFGTGLGIPAVEKIVEQHGGRLDVRSTLGGGATFEIRLPLEGVDQEAAA